MYITPFESDPGARGLTAKAKIAGKDVGWITIAKTHPTSLKAQSEIALKTDRVWYVQSAFVAEPYRRQGIGKELYLAAIKEASKRSCILVAHHLTRGGKTSPQARLVWDKLNCHEDSRLIVGNSWAYYYHPAKYSIIGGSSFCVEAIWLLLAIASICCG